MAHKATLNAPRYCPEFGDTRVCSFVGLCYDVADLSPYLQATPDAAKKQVLE
jgi:hypothetical protein